MSRPRSLGSFGWFVTTTKKPPPEHGIRVKKAGTTWWGERWIQALESVLRGHAGRLARGKTYARAGRTHDLIVRDGTVTAKVTGSRAEPYTITLQLSELKETAWRKAISVMAQKAQFSAELIAGRMPEDIDDAFREAGVSLFPKQRSDLKTSCTCPDWGDPCKHVAATHYVLGEALDKDPFLLFELRGKTREQVLDALRAARSKDDPGPPKRTQQQREPRAESLEVPTVTLGKLKAADYEKPREALPSFHFTFAEPASHGAILRQLGTPAAWQGEASPADALTPLVRAAAETARRIAMQDAADVPETSPAKTTRGRSQPARKKR